MRRRSACHCKKCAIHENGRSSHYADFFLHMCTQSNGTNIQRIFNLRGCVTTSNQLLEQLLRGLSYYTTSMGIHFLKWRTNKKLRKGVIHKPRGHIFWVFLTPLPPSWSLLQNKAYVIKWSFGYPLPLNCPRG